MKRFAHLRQKTISLFGLRLTVYSDWLWTGRKVTETRSLKWLHLGFFTIAWRSK